MKISECLKHCKKCDTVKHFTEFHKSAGNKDGLQSYCAECVNKESKAARDARTKKQKERVNALLAHPDTKKLQDAKKVIKNLLISVEALSLGNSSELSTAKNAIDFLNSIK